MRKYLSLLMGTHECASPAELRRQYQRLVTAIVAAEFDCNPDQLRRYVIARERLAVAYEKAKKQLSHTEEMHGSVTGSGLLLGELLIDAGLISQEQLDDALAAQGRTKPPPPLGRILVARGLITWEQLAYYLKLQDLLQLSPTHAQRLSRQLIELGLTSRGEMDVAGVDCETTGCSMFHAVSRRGWIQPSILALLTGTLERTERKLSSEEEGVATFSGKLFVISA
jgi:hypothetical protein